MKISLGRIVLIFGIICLITIILYVSCLYLNKQKITESLFGKSIIERDERKTMEPVKEKKIEDSFSNISYLHWSHMPIKYRINFSEYDKGVEEKKIKNVIYAFERITKEIPYIAFIETKNNDEDILFAGEIPASLRVNLSKTYGMYNIGGLSIKDNILGEYIYHSTIYLPEALNNDPDFISAYPVNTEVHEILHSFGVKHTNVIGGVMSGFAGAGSNGYAPIEEDIISCLKDIYSNSKDGEDVCYKTNTANEN